MTPQKVADISEPIEQLYSDLTDELLINIARHLSKSTATWSALHEIETLEEMGQLTQENIEIINTYVAKMPEEIKKAMNESRLEALGEIENKLQQAADNGYLTKPVTDSTVDVVQALSSQAAEQLNLVNQTMLNTSLQQYQNGIYEFRQEMQNAAPRTIESVDDLQIAQNEINIAAGKTATGTETRYNAMRKAISNLNKAGIVGYYDRANRAWTAEAYVNMDIRTTVHNTYIQSVQTRQQDYGSDVFQVSAHAGARPLCYPYQGKLYSWGASGGTIRLGDGKTYRFEPIGETSYGEPAGLFGINCGHVPYPMIAGVSEPVKEDIQSKEENDKQYQDSQKQRALERQIRYAKRNVEMLGDLATDADRDKIKQAQAQMRAFIQSTGRTRRYDREQIVTQRGTTGIKPTVKTPITPTPIKTKPNTYVNAITIEDAERKANYFTDVNQWAATGVSYKGISVDVANIVNKTLTEFYDKYNVNKFGGVIAPTGNSKEGKMIQNATAAYSPVRNSFLLNRTTLKNISTAEKALKAEKEVVTDYLKNPDKYDITKMSTRAYKVLENSKVSGRGTVPDTIEEVITHELGHSLEKQISNNTNVIALKQRMEQYAPKISGYACESWGEYVAESFASYTKGEKVADPELIKAFKELER
jgi:hypothetical protein